MRPLYVPQSKHWHRGAPQSLQQDGTLIDENWRAVAYKIEGSRGWHHWEWLADHQKIQESLEEGAIITAQRRANGDDPEHTVAVLLAKRAHD